MLTQQFAQTLIQDQNTVVFAEGDTTSSTLTCAGGLPRNIYTPSNWTPCNISFETAYVPDGPFHTKVNFDGSPFSIPTEALQDIPLMAPMFDATSYMRVICSAPQEEDANLLFGRQPLYQGIHN